MEPDARQYLAQIREISEGILEPEEAWVAQADRHGRESPGCWHRRIAGIARPRFRLQFAPTHHRDRTALNLDRHFEDAWLRLRELQDTAGRIGDAEATLRAGLAIVPEAGPLQNGLGLLLAERGGHADAVEHLEIAAALMPDDPRVRYNIGLALESLGRTGAAELALLEALSLVPSDPEILYAIGFHHLNRGRLQEAEAHANRLVERHPDRPEGHLLLKEIARRGRGQ